MRRWLAGLRKKERVEGGDGGSPAELDELQKMQRAPF